MQRSSIAGIMRKLFLGALLFLGAVAAVLGGGGTQKIDSFFHKTPGVTWVPVVAVAAAAAGIPAVPGGVAVRAHLWWPSRAC